MSISKIKLSGGFFNSSKEFQFFHNHSQVATVVYGKNGSGKSSISRAFQEALKQDIGDSDGNEFTSVEFYKLKSHPEQGNEYIPTTEISIPCYVHNENFTHKTVSFNEKGLETIVMFGEQIDIKKELDSLEKELEIAEKEYEDTIELFDKISNPKETDSYLYFEEQIKTKLKKQWAVRQQKINEIKTLGRVDNSLLKEILNYQNTNYNYHELMAEYQTKFDKYLKLKSASPIEKVNLFSLPSNVNKLKQLLCLELDQPVLSEKEQQILDVYSSLNSTKASEARDFLKSSKSICPVCFQDVETQYKLSVLDAIRKILNTEDANRLINNLLKVKLEQYTIDYSSFASIVESNIIDTLKLEIETYNGAVNKLIYEQQNKINNPYNPINLNLDINNIATKINKVIETVNSQIENFNKEIKLKKKAADDLRLINRKLAYLENSDLITLHKEKHEFFLEISGIKEVQYKSLNTIKSKISAKKASLANVEIALELINHYLQYIFYDEKRLYLVSSDNAYKIMSRDQPVKPSSLSVGEKNIISLCYFFSTLFQNQNIGDLFKNECILILDDPLSSFDFENKVGVYSFLRYIINELHSGNSKSKSIIFTHDLDVLYNISKVYNDIKIKDKKIKLFYLDKQIFKVVNSENYDEYSILFQNIYDFAAGHSSDSINIGNNLRRILEAYATFNYKCGIEQFTRNEDVLSKLPSDHHREYFKNSMYRLVLNTESHFKERTRLLLSNSFKEHFSLEEKSRTARDILMLIYLLDEIHLKFHLKVDNDDLVEFKIEKIKSWLDESFRISETVS